MLRLTVTVSALIVLGLLAFAGVHQFTASADANVGHRNQLGHRRHLRTMSRIWGNRSTYIVARTYMPEAVARSGSRFICRVRVVNCVMRSAATKLLKLDVGDAHDEAAVEAALAVVPAPRSPDVLLAKLCSLGVKPDDLVIDLGCGHGQYAQQIASVTGCKVVALDLSAQCVVETRAAIGQAQAARVHIARAVAEALPLRHHSADSIWCRDMLNHVDLPLTLRGCAAVLAPAGYMLVYQTFATELLEPSEARRLYEAFAIVPRNMNADYFEACAHGAGFTIIERDAIASEWREWWEVEGSRKTSANLLRAARLLRGGQRVRKLLGENAYEFALADQFWGVYQMIGKLCPTVYALRRG